MYCWIIKEKIVNPLFSSALQKIQNNHWLQYLLNSPLAKNTGGFSAAADFPHFLRFSFLFFSDSIFLLLLFYFSIQFTLLIPSAFQPLCCCLLFTSPNYSYNTAIMEKDSHSPPVAPDLEASPSPEPKPRQSSLTRRWKESVDPTHADLICLLLCFLTGLCDSSAYNAWSCFLGMQTGMSSPSYC